MAAVTICSDFGAPKNKIWHCFHCFPIYFPWSDGTRCHDLCFLNLKFGWHKLANSLCVCVRHFQCKHKISPCVCVCVCVYTWAFSELELFIFVSQDMMGYTSNYRSVNIIRCSIRKNLVQKLLSLQGNDFGQRNNMVFKQGKIAISDKGRTFFWANIPQWKMLHILTEGIPTLCYSESSEYATVIPIPLVKCQSFLMNVLTSIWERVPGCKINF